MLAPALPCLALLLAAARGRPGLLGPKAVSQRDAEFERAYVDEVNSELVNIYTFNHTVTRNRTEGVRVSVNVLNKQKGAPLLFVVRQKEAVVSFQVPLILRGLFQRKYLYQKVERTLCQPPTKNESEVQFFYVDVSTLSPVNTTYQLQVSRMDDFVLRTGEPFSFNTTAAQPQYFKYEFPEGVDSVIVKVTSTKAFPCSVISIQDVLCPVYDLDNNVAFIGMYQTMTKKAAITVQRKDFPSNSFYVVVVVKTEDQACGGSLPFYPFVEDEPVDQGHRQKTLSVLVSEAVTSEAYVGGMLFCLGIFLSFYLLTILLACWENWRQRRKTLLLAVDRACPESASLLGHPRVLANSFPGSSPYEEYNYGSFENCSGSTEGLVDSMDTADLSYSCQGHDQFKRRLPFGQMRQLCIAMDRPLDPVGTRPRLDSMSSVEEDDYDTLTDIESDKNVIRTKQYLCVADLARKDKRVLRKKYQIYFWNIATIAVFYALPVVQLVITYQTVVNVTGNQDICYYNFLCAHPLGNLSAFNNILSNLGYILLGLLFLLIILQREINHNRALMRNDLYALQECGIPKHFGLFYAMGTALMMEGLLSACYHVCPNYTNFQFGPHGAAGHGQHYQLVAGCLRTHHAPQRLRLLLAGHRHLQPASVLRLLHHYEAPKRGKDQAYPPALHRLHLGGLGLRTLLLLPGTQHLAGAADTGRRPGHCAAGQDLCLLGTRPLLHTGCTPLPPAAVCRPGRVAAPLQSVARGASQPRCSLSPGARPSPAAVCRLGVRVPAPLQSVARGASQPRCSLSPGGARPSPAAVCRPGRVPALLQSVAQARISVLLPRAGGSRAPRPSPGLVLDSYGVASDLAAALCRGGGLLP
ncbi:SID1 transmembrane family member 2 isoform X2 [Molossus molossus]|uniref:SID1 transmembrane family member 2 isoform X2 n=1 Tax=Molossus molossus TaxID=27622 RepID=UPI001746A45B|nr:SID1 transmembrane family member 2 isoform X2 [Molossus molossus]